MNTSKVVSVTLFGQNRKYLQGAIKLADSVLRKLPGWNLVFFVGKSVPEETISNLVSRNSRIVRVDGDEGLSATAWRFRLHELGDSDWVLFRDSDSVISQREAHAIGQWVNSGKGFHIIRDHPFHSAKILAGLWGLKPEAAPWFREAVEAYSFTNDYGSDQEFLASKVYPRILESSLVHASFHQHESSTNTAKFQIGSDRVGDFCGESITSPLYIRIYARLQRLLAPKACLCK